MLADRQVAASLKAAGYDIELPTLADARTRFDAALNEEPAVTTHSVLRVALGLVS